MKKAKEIYTEFMLFFDGCYMIDPAIDNLSTYIMGVTKIKYDEKTDSLTVNLRRPGLIIGKGGKTIDRLKEHLGCEIHIEEVKNLFD